MLVESQAVVGSGSGAIYLPASTGRPGCCAVKGVVSEMDVISHQY